VGNGRITPMKNKNLLLLPILLITAATHCMKKLIAYEPKTMQELQNNRDIFKKTLDDNDLFWWFGTTSCPNRYILDCTYRQGLHSQTYGKNLSLCKNNLFVFLETILDEKFFKHYNIDNLKNLSSELLEILKKVRGYQDKQYSALGSATMAEKVSLQEKKVFIQKLRNLGFQPTSDDKELALVEQWERCHKKLVFFLSPPLSEIEIPQDVTNYITLLLWQAEGSLL
jgi:hypothetical protein